MWSAKKPFHWLCPCSQSFAGGWQGTGRGQVNPGCTVWPGKNATLLLQTSRSSWGSLWPHTRCLDCCTEKNTDIMCALYRDHLMANQVKPIRASLSKKVFIMRKEGYIMEPQRRNSSRSQEAWNEDEQSSQRSASMFLCLLAFVCTLVPFSFGQWGMFCFAPVPRVEYGHPISLKKLTGWLSVPIQISEKELKWPSLGWVSTPSLNCV